MCSTVFSILVSDIYSPQIGRSSVLDTALHRLRDTVDREVTYAKKLLEVIGELDTLFSASQQFQMSLNDTETVSVDCKNELNLLPSTAAQVS